MPKKNAKRLYHKLFLTYTVIIACIVFALMIYFISATKSRILKTNLDYMEMLGEKAVSYVEDSGNTVTNINNELYRNTSILQDVIHYLQDGEEEYQRYRLDTYMASPDLSYAGIDNYVEKVLDAYSDISKLEFLSYSRGEITSFYAEGGNHKRKTEEDFLDKITSGNAEEYGTFSFLKEIRDLESRQSVGCMILTFHTDKLSAMMPLFTMTEMILVNDFGTLLFDSEQRYPAEAIIKANQEDKMEQLLSAYVSKKMVNDNIVYTYVEKNRASRMSVSVFLSILAIGVIAIIIGEALVHYYLRRLSGRLDYILEGMQKVTTGDLSVRLDADTKGDELDLISGNFNEMCEKLDRYIQKSYLAEIEQRNAEIEVLQNQVNPHFLYNTLEAIRMKAICNGDREVGKMLYSMAVIFRSQLKDSDIITVIQEIHYCKKYLELFEYRYQDKFTFAVECPEELMNYPIIKFIIQPVLENYFVHGIQPEIEGNHISVSVEKGNLALWIHVIDNGQGMNEEQMSEKNRELEENHASTKKSIGLMNVNRRLKAIYGAKYGVYLNSSESGGLHVTMKAGLEECI